MTRLICKFCGGDRFDQMGEVRVDAWRRVESITRGDDGKLNPKFGHVEREGGVDDRDFDPDCFRCVECEREESKLADLVGPPVLFEPGALVVCPDGFKGTVETVDFERRRLTGQGWHEEFKFADVDALVPGATNV